MHFAIIYALNLSAKEYNEIRKLVDEYESWKHGESGMSFLKWLEVNHG